MTILKRSTFTETITFLFVILFLYTGISKVTEYAMLKEQIAMSPLLASTASFTAAVLPWVEFLAVVLLVIPRWRLKGFWASLVLMTFFTIYIIAMLSFNKNIPCSCGGVIELLSWNAHIVFNSVFIGLALTGVILERKIRKENKNTLETIVE